MENIEKELAKELSRTGLPVSSFKSILDRAFFFSAEFRSHHCAIVGKITGFGISDEGGLDFYVSIPRFAGRKLISLKFDADEKQWLAVVDSKDVIDRFYLGNFHFL